MKSIHDLIADESLATEGKWFDYDDEVKFRIAYSGNDKYLTKVDALLLKARRLNHGKEPTTAQRKDVMVEAMIGNVFLDWSGLVESYSADNARILLSGKSDVLGFVLSLAGEAKNFREEGDSASPAEELKSDLIVVAAEVERPTTP